MAFEFDKDSLENGALFPHILSRNCCYRANFGHEKYNLLTKTKVTKRQVDVPSQESNDTPKKSCMLIYLPSKKLNFHFIIFLDKKDEVKEEEKTEDVKAETLVYIFLQMLNNVI